jgi:tetratricopeptide (TPR) repeat protein
LLEPAIQRCRKMLEPFRHDRLTISQESRAASAHFDASERSVVARLSAAPHSFEELRLLNLTSIERLVALTHALRLTKQVTPTNTRDSRVPRAASSQALRAVNATQRRSSSPAPTDDAEGKRRLDPAAQRRLWQERTAESKSLEAWALAEGDSRQLSRALAVVERAAKAYPKNAQIRFYCACLHKQARDVNRAMNEFRLVLDLEPDNMEAQRELSLLRRNSESAKRGMFGRLRKKR